MKSTLTAFVILAVVPACLPAQDLFQKLTFEGMGGAAVPLGSAKDRLNTGYDFIFGAGWKFTPQVSTLLEIQYAHFSLNDNALQAFQQPAGYNTFWGVTINPRYYFPTKGKWSGYGTAGYGLYARTLAFTDPSQAIGYCDPYYGCYSSGAPVVASTTNYKGGVNVGGGVTYALGGGLRVVSDVRYNRFLSHANNEYITISFGILF